MRFFRDKVGSIRSSSQVTDSFSDVAGNARKQQRDEAHDETLTRSRLVSGFKLSFRGLEKKPFHHDFLVGS